MLWNWARVRVGVRVRLEVRVRLRVRELGNETQGRGTKRLPSFETGRVALSSDKVERISLHISTALPWVTRRLLGRGYMHISSPPAHALFILD